MITGTIKTVTYQEAKDEFDVFIAKWKQFVETVSRPLLQAHMQT